MPNAVIAHAGNGEFDLHALKEEAREWPGSESMTWCRWSPPPSASPGTRRRGSGTRASAGRPPPEFNVVAIDYGIQRNILRLLAGVGCKITVVPATTSAEDILAMKPDGVFLSNGPGDPAETGKYACARHPASDRFSGHANLRDLPRAPDAGLAVGAKTRKMHQGHHGANHPVKDETTGKVEITSMNHGFAVDQATLPKGATQTHISLFD